MAAICMNPTNSELRMIEAAQQGHVSQVESFLEEGVNVDAKDPFFKTALMYASVQGNTDLILLLFRHGANVNECTNNGYTTDTALILTCEQNQIEAAEMLLQHGADVNFESRFNWTALHWACDLGNEDLVSLLLHYGANPSLQNNDGLAPLQLAILENQMNIIRVFQNFQDGTENLQPNVVEDQSHSLRQQNNENYQPIIENNLRRDQAFDIMIGDNQPFPDVVGQYEILDLRNLDEENSNHEGDYSSFASDVPSLTTSPTNDSDEDDTYE
jgi:ankyrin repeat protein